MQTPDKKKQVFLDMQEHPEKYSDQQIEAMMDELDHTADTEAAWQRFFAAQTNHRFTVPVSRYKKMAASFIGVALVSGIAFAAIHIVRQYQQPQLPQIEQTASVTKPVNIVSIDTLAADTLAVVPRIFENVPLDSMLIEMAGYYHVAVDFQRDDAHLLRFHFVWKPKESLDRVVERLNNFEAVHIVREPEKLIVR